nr:RHS repeat-associated core domain-containing protein [Superficieibacter electus]
MIGCVLRFMGQWFDEESGLHYNLHRYYDPQTGQYLLTDPIGL